MLALHITYDGPEDNTQKSVALNPLGVLFHEAIDIPLTTRAKGHFDVLGPLFSPVERFQHICAQEEYANFSPEELRWKHELYNRVTGFKS